MANQICFPKTNPNEEGAQTLIINRITYVKIGENNTSVCYAPLVGSRRKRRKSSTSTPCPEICITGNAESELSPPPPIPPRTEGCTGMVQTLEDITLGVPYINPLEIDPPSGTPPFVWAIIVGTLPDFTTLNPVTGEIVYDGDTAIVGQYPITVQVTDANGCTGTQEFILNVKN